LPRIRKQLINRSKQVMISFDWACTRTKATDFEFVAF